MTNHPPVYAASIPVNETERLDSLNKLNLLDSEPDPRFDDITELVSHVFDVPIVLVSLVDENRQWFVSKCGLSTKETPRDDAFCAHALHEKEILVIENATLHPVMRFNPLVTGEPHICFYAGAVIRDNEGLPLGTLCIIDTATRVFNYDEQRKLIKFAELVRKEMNVDQKHNLSITRVNLKNNKDPVTQAFVNDRLYSEVERYLYINKPVAYVGLQLRIINLRTYGDAFGNFIANRLLFETYERLSQTLKRHGDVLFGRDNNDLINVFFSPQQDIKNISLQTILELLEGALSTPVKTTAGEVQLHIILSVVQLNHQSEHFRDAIRLIEKAQLGITTSKNVEIILVDNNVRQSIEKSNMIATELNRAIDDNELRLVYQPKVCPSTNTVVGYECLLRWEHPQVGNISPVDIMKTAGDTNLTFKLEQWIFKQALIQLNEWRHSKFIINSLSINLTGATLLTPLFFEKLKTWMVQFEIPENCLDIEIVEGSIFHDYEHAVHVISQINAMGVSFSLDDFGTGFSNLSYLKKLPIRTLKIDKSFIDDITHCEKSRALCSSIIHMAKQLKMISVAEGVESANQARLLKKLNCDLIQGFYYSKPLEADKIPMYSVRKNLMSKN